MDFPSNDHKNREKKEEPKKIEKVVTGKVVTRKKPLGKRILETFVGEDVGNVYSYVLYDVLIPAAKSMIYDSVKGGLEMRLFGEKQGSRTRRDQGRSYVSYNNYSDSRRPSDRREMTHQNRARHNFEEIILDSRGEAEEVLSHLVDLIVDYGQATVSDLYDLVGIAENFTDRRYGWVDLRHASVGGRTRDGYLLNLPKPILLD